MVRETEGGDEVIAGRGTRRKEEASTSTGNKYKGNRKRLFRIKARNRFGFKVLKTLHYSVGGGGRMLIQ